jgi:hypothetical protein
MSFICCTPQISLGRSNRGEWGGRVIGEEKIVQLFGGKVHAKESNRKSEEKMRRRDQNGY